MEVAAGTTMPPVIDPRWLVVVLTTGCATSASLGTRATATSTGGRSLEVEGSVAGGIGDSTSAFEVREQADIGLSPAGKLEGRFITGPEYISFGARAGWQAALLTGISVGAFQDDDLTLELVAGPHWNLGRESSEQRIQMWSLALDVGVGYAVHVDNVRGDGALLSASVTVRYDVLDSSAKR